MKPKHAATVLFLSLVLSGCMARPYYGRSVVEEDGQLVCGRHHVPVDTHEGYIFDGLITFVDEKSMDFASDRFPNLLNGTFMEKKTEHATFPFTDYTCTECKAGDRKLDRLPMWYKRIAGMPAKLRREIQIERAASKAERTGNLDDAKVPAGDGTVRRIR